MHTQWGEYPVLQIYGLCEDKKELAVFRSSPSTQFHTVCVSFP